MTKHVEAPLPIPAEDYTSIQIVFRTARHGQAVPTASVQTVVFSDQTPQQVLASLARYYREPEVLISERGIALMMDAGEDHDYAFVYFTPENVQVVMENDTFAGLATQFGDSIKGTVDFLNIKVAELVFAQSAGAAGFVQVHRIDFEIATDEAPKV